MLCCVYHGPATMHASYLYTRCCSRAAVASTDVFDAHVYVQSAQDGFYISPAFLDKLSIHVAKNFMDLPKIKVPLILGIWGGKGQGKTFQVCLPVMQCLPRLESSCSSSSAVVPPCFAHMTITIVGA